LETTSIDGGKRLAFDVRLLRRSREPGILPILMNGIVVASSAKSAIHHCRRTISAFFDKRSRLCVCEAERRHISQNGANVVTTAAATVM
jgi:hypothetical protein